MRAIADVNAASTSGARQIGVKEICRRHTDTNRVGQALHDGRTSDSAEEDLRVFDGSRQEADVIERRATSRAGRAW